MTEISGGVRRIFALLYEATIGIELERARARARRPRVNLGSLPGTVGALRSKTFYIIPCTLHVEDVNFY